MLKSVTNFENESKIELELAKLLSHRNYLLVGKGVRPEERGEKGE